MMLCSDEALAALQCCANAACDECALNDGDLESRECIEKMATAAMYLIKNQQKYIATIDEMLRLARGERDIIGKRNIELEIACSDMRNELCQHCGKYRQAHEGACDGCRWKGDLV